MTNTCYSRIFKSFALLTFSISIAPILENSIGKQSVTAQVCIDLSPSSL